MRKITALVPLSLLIAISMPSTAGASEAREGVVMMLDAINSQCGSMSAQFRKTPGLGSALSSRPENLLCDCVEKRLEAMPLVAEIQGFDDAKINMLMDQPAFKDYLVAKLSATMFTCVTDELNAGAEAIRPEM
ncbi:MAG: hypothetical protein JNM58_15860 [Xanthomonadaceae bacterium]|nr:hypothetical protein [Xanthomonadaceae bacterium]